MGWRELLEWQNLVFELPLVAVLLYIVALALGGVGHGDAGGLSGGHDLDADADLDADVDADADAGAGGHDVHVHAEVHAGGHVEHADVAHDQGGGVVPALLSLLGVGRVPLAVVFICFFALFGLLGLVLNGALGSLGLPAILFFWPALAGALVGSGFLTGRVARLVARIMPTSETYVVRREDFGGRVGTALYSVTERSGVAVVADDSGTLHQVACRTREGEPPIPKNTPLLLVSYEARTQSFTVCPAPAELTSLPGEGPGEKGHP